MMKRIGLVVLSMASGVLAASLPSEEMAVDEAVASPLRGAGSPEAASPSVEGSFHLRDHVEFALINEGRWTPNRAEIEKKADAGFILFTRIIGQGIEPVVSDPRKQTLVRTLLDQMYEGARIGHLESLYYLGEANKHLGDIPNAYGFYLLALEEHWMRYVRLPSLPGDMSSLRTPAFWTEIIERLRDTGQWTKGPLDIVGLYPTEQEKSSKGKKKAATVAAAAEPLSGRAKMDLMSKKSRVKFEQTPYLTLGVYEARQEKMRVRMEAQRSSDPFSLRATELIVEGEHEKARLLLVQSASDDAHLMLGLHYASGEMGKLANGMPDYEKALSYLRLTQNPLAYSNLAKMYALGNVGRREDGTPNYAMAAEYSLKAAEGGIREEYQNLGFLYVKGHVGRLADGTPDYEQALTYFRSGRAYTNIALLYVKGIMGHLENGEPDYAQAQRYLRLSNDPESRAVLGTLYARGRVGRLASGEPNYGEAIKLLRDSGARGQLSLYELYAEKTPAELGLTAAQIEDDKKKTKERFSSALRDKLPGFVAYHRGYIDFLDRNYDSALIRLQDVALKGSLDIDAEAVQTLIDTIRKIMSSQAEIIHLERELDAAEKGQMPVEEMAASAVNSLKTVLEEEEKPSEKVLQLEFDDQKEERERSDQGSSEDEEEEGEGQLQAVASGEKAPLASDEGSYAPKRTKVARHKLKVENIKSRIERNRAKILEKNLSDSLGGLKDREGESPVSEPIDVVYNSKKIEQSCKTEFGREVEELLLDITQGVWKTEGRGKPEILKSVRMVDSKGKRLTVYSRRLSKGDRFVYTVTGPRQILVIGCGGHYNELS